MKRTLTFAIAVVCTAALVALARPTTAAAGWCWPSCSGYGYLGPSTTTNTGCWYSSGEVCSYYGNWFNIGMSKTCYPGCNWNYQTTSMVLYGFENHDRIRGRLTVKADTVYLEPAWVGMNAPLRSQVSWYAGPASQIHAGAIGG